MQKTIDRIFRVVGFALYLLADERRRDRHKGTWFAEFVTVSNSDFKIYGRISKMELKEGQRVRLNVAPKTKRGHAASIEAGSGRWTSTDDAVVSVEQDPTDELSAFASGLDGSANETVAIEFRGDADRSAEGVREIIGTLAVTCTTGDAAVLDIEPGTPEDIPDASATGTTETGTAGTADNPGNVPADTSTGSPSEPSTTDATDTAPATTDDGPPA